MIRVIAVLFVVCLAGCPKARVIRAPQVYRYDPCEDLPSKAVLDSYVGMAAKQRENGAPDYSDAVPDSPPKIYENFSYMAGRMTKAESVGCSTLRIKKLERTGTSFQDEWEHLQRMESARVEALAAMKAANAKAVSDAKQAIADHVMSILEKAHGHGYDDVIFGSSLTDAIAYIVEKNVSPATLSKKVVELDDYQDEYFRVLQYLGNGSALYSSELTDRIVLLRDYGDVLIEGSSLLAIRNHYIVIKGVASYRTTMGTRQAIVIETAW